MTEDTNRGYTVPLPANPRDSKRLLIIVGLAVLAFCLVYDLGGEPSSSVIGARIRGFRRIIPVLYPVIVLLVLLRCGAKLRIAPRGITITWGRWTMNGMLAERIVLLAGVFCNSHYYLAVCPRTVEELAEVQSVEMPKMYQDARTKPGWTEEMASRYLRKQGRSLFRHTQPILWLVWSPERLEMLQTMYPHAQWLDTTSDKQLDAQLAGNPSRKS